MVRMETDQRGNNLSNSMTHRTVQDFELWRLGKPGVAGIAWDSRGRQDADVVRKEAGPFLSLQP